MIYLKYKLKKMKAVNFKEANVIFAKDQNEYQKLPAFKENKTKEGKVTTCWELSFFERIQVLFTGKIYLSQLTFNKPLQPQKLTIKFEK